MSPYKLMSTFEAPDDHIRTLHDNWETSVSRYPHVSMTHAIVGSK